MNRYKRKIKYLTKKHNIDWQVFNVMEVMLLMKGEGTAIWGTAFSLTDIQTIYTPRIEGEHVEETFAAALHEIGHCISYKNKSTKEKSIHLKKSLSARLRNASTKHIVDEEFAAWNIARKLAGSLWSSKMDMVQLSCLSSYIAHYAHTHKRFPYYPEHVYNLLNQ